MHRQGLDYQHPVVFWSGCFMILVGVLAHIPMFIHSASMSYQMSGMAMDTSMLVGMGLIPLGVLLAWFGVKPRIAFMREITHSDAPINFHLADNSPLNVEHWKLVVALLIAVTVDVMKPATLGFVMPGMTEEYALSHQEAGSLALIALTGTVIGSFIWGRLADVLGRRAAIQLSALMFIGTAICGSMPRFEWNLVMCFIMGLSAGGLLPITFTLMAEVIPAAHRGWLLVALGGIGTAAGFLVASGAAAILEPIFSWRVLWLLGLPTGLIIILLNRYIPESPRFLASVGLNRQARAVLQRFNGVDTSAGTSVNEEPTLAREGVRQMLSGPYTKLTLGLMGAGLAWGLVNFGFLLWLPTNLRQMGISAEAANGLLAQSGVLALPGVLAVVWLYHSWSSINTLVVFIGLTAASMLAFLVLGILAIESNLAITLATACVLISASGVISMLIPYAAEIYPVHLRGTGTGLVAASSKAGGIFGSLFGMAGVFDDLAFSALLISVPLLIFGVLLYKNGIDTRGRQLEDIQAAVRGNSSASAGRINRADSRENLIKQLRKTDT